MIKNLLTLSIFLILRHFKNMFNDLNSSVENGKDKGVPELSVYDLSFDLLNHMKVQYVRILRYHRVIDVLLLKIIQYKPQSLICRQEVHLYHLLLDCLYLVSIISK